LNYNGFSSVSPDNLGREQDRGGAAFELLGGIRASDSVA